MRRIRKQVGASRIVEFRGAMSRGSLRLPLGPPPLAFATDVGRRPIEEAWFRRDHVPFGWDPRQPQRAPLKRIWVRADKIVEVVRDVQAQRALLQQSRLQGAGR